MKFKHGCSEYNVYQFAFIVMEWNINWSKMIKGTIPLLIYGHRLKTYINPFVNEEFICAIQNQTQHLNVIKGTLSLNIEYNVIIYISIDRKFTK